MAAKTQFTLEDYLALEEPDGPRHELSEGELLVTPATTSYHNRVQFRLRASLEAYIERHPLGVVTSESDFLLGPDTVRRPDVAVTLASRYRAEYEKAVPIPAAPDVAFEIISEHDRPGALRVKVKQYLAAGTRAVWLLDPAKREAQRYAAGASEPEFRESIEESELLPGLKIPLPEVFGN